MCENVWDGIESYFKPWYLRDMGSWRRRVSTEDVSQRPRKPRDGFLHTCRRKAPTIFTLGSFAEVGAPSEKKIGQEYLKISLPASGCVNTHRGRYRMPQNNYDMMVQFSLVPR